MLIGRARELERLDRALSGGAAGRGGVVALCGEAGIGKTHLADEVADRAARREGFLVVWGRAWETEGAPPYWPWIECLTAITERAGDAIELPRALGALVDVQARSVHSPANVTHEGLRTDAARERFDLFDAVASFFRAVARKTPLFVVLDDLHAADVATLELLVLVARGLRASRIIILATYRDVEARRAPVADVFGRISREAEVLPLGPLPREDVAEIVRHELGAFDAKVARRIFDVTEGNPLFVRETLRALALSGETAVDPIEALENKGAGAGIAAIVRSRLAGAAARTTELIELGAVLGREIEPSLLASAAKATLGEVMSTLREGAARGLLVTRGRAPERWVFSHVLVREALYRELAPERRRAFHESIAHALRERVESGRDDQLATVAHHAIESLPTADPADVAAAMATARRAAERARAQLAHDEAITLLERALATYEVHGASAHSSEHTNLLVALGWAATETGRLERGRDVFRQVASMARGAGDGRLLARAALGQGGAYVFAEIRSELVDLLREALDALGARAAVDVEDRRLMARVLARLAGALTPNPEPAEPLAMARRAIAMTRDETDTRTRIDVDVGAGSALIDFAPAVERIPVDERLLRDARQIGDRVLELRALTRLGCDYIEKGDLVSASIAIDARAALGDALESPRFRWASPLLRSMRAMLEGRFDDCEALAAEAHAIATDSRCEDPNAVRCIAVHRFCLSVIAGRNEHLASRMTDALRTLEPLGDAGLRMWVVASGSAALGDRARALEALRTMLFTHTASGARNIRSMAANAAAACEAREECAVLHEFLARHGGGFSCWGPFGFACTPPVAQGLAAAAFGCGRRADGIRWSNDALALCTETGARGLEPWVRLTWGEGLAKTGDARDAADARSQLERALAIANDLGMPVVVARARASLTALSTVREPSPPPQSARPPAFDIARSGEKWTVTHDGRSFTLKDVRGVAMIARLVASAGREIHALDLASDPGATDAVVDLGDAGVVIDSRAREQYRARIVDLRRELDEAERFADRGRADRLRRELEALTDQLAGAVGIGGRERRTGSAAERARITVQRRVREAIKRIGEQDAELARHLDWTIRTGTFCAYEPDGRNTSR